MPFTILKRILWIILNIRIILKSKYKESIKGIVLKNVFLCLNAWHSYLKTQEEVWCWRLSVQFSRSVMSNSSRPHELQHARPPCPSPSPGVHSNSHLSSRWCHPAISSSVVPISSCPQSLPASESFPMSQLFAWGGQSIEVSALASSYGIWMAQWFPYFLQFKPEFCNKEFIIWAIVSTSSFFCWLYRAFPSLTTKNTIKWIVVLTIWWCPCVELSLGLLQMGDCYDQRVLWTKFC